MKMKLNNSQPVRTGNSRGVALITVLLLLMLLSAVAVALMYAVNGEQRLQNNDLGQGGAYYAAEAGIEKMTSDINDVFANLTVPSTVQIAGAACPGGGACANSPRPADLNGTTFSEYQINVPQDGQGNPAYLQRQITQGPYAGMQAQLLPLTLSVTSDRPGGEEARLTRNVEVALIPVFQFGIFSSSDLSYFAGSNFDFGGRVHTNGNLFLAQQTGSNLTFQKPVSASLDVVRDTLANGLALNSAADNVHQGNVYIPLKSGGCPIGGGNSQYCRALGWNNPDEGSSIGGTIQPPGIPTAGGQPNGINFATWDNISKNIYKSFVQAHVLPPLVLPFVRTVTGQPPVNQIEVIRRAQPGDSQALTQSRLFNKAQIRVILTDTQAELPCPGNRLSLAALPSPLATGANGDAAQTQPPSGAAANLIDGWICVQISSAPGVYSEVTNDWLSFGVARQQAFPDSEHGGVVNTENSNAILLLEQVNDAVTGGAARAGTGADYIPLNLYDAREGQARDIATGRCNIAGVMNVVDIDVRNLQQYILSNLPIAPPVPIDQQSQNGYVLYFSDRRGMVANPKLAPPAKIGEYGFTDVINEAVADGTPNQQPDPGELTNVDGSVEFFGGQNLGLGFGPNTIPNPLNPFLPVQANGGNSGCQIARTAWISGARHAVRLINGSAGNLPLRNNANPNNTGGFTLATENPAYIYGNYNTTDAGYANPHASAGVVADAVTLLSKNWNDSNSFTNPTNPSGRPALQTYYRVAIAGGKNQNFNWNNVANLPGGGRPGPDFGRDGGVHNFLRYLEGWNGQTLFYKGSLVSLYYSYYATGVYKCCTIVYGVPVRTYNFDDDFNNLSEMPPGTPRFQAIDNVAFQEDFSNR